MAPQYDLVLDSLITVCKNEDVGIYLQRLLPCPRDLVPGRGRGWDIPSMVNQSYPEFDQAVVLESPASFVGSSKDHRIVTIPTGRWSTKIRRCPASIAMLPALIGPQ